MAVPTESQLNNVTLTPAQHPLDPLTPEECWQQQKWDTFVKERSRGCGSIVGLPALPVVALTPS